VSCPSLSSCRVSLKIGNIRSGCNETRLGKGNRGHQDQNQPGKLSEDQLCNERPLSLTMQQERGLLLKTAQDDSRPVVGVVEGEDHPANGDDNGPTVLPSRNTCPLHVVLL
jgi:hypothetical protein